MNLKMQNRTFNIISIAIIVLDVVNVLLFDTYMLRGIFWLFLVSVLLIYNLIHNNRLANLLLIIYELFLLVCHLMSLFILTYESEWTRFAVEFDTVINTRNLDDGVFYTLLIFLQPITVGLIALIIGAIIRKIVKSKKS